MATLPAGAVAFWSFNNINGVLAPDSVDSHDGIIVGATAVLGSGLAFDGTDDFVSVPDSSAFDFGSGDFTIDFWAKFAAAPGGSLGHPGDVFISQDQGSGSQNKWFLSAYSGFIDFHVNSPSLGPQFFAITPFNPTPGQWYNIALTRSGPQYIMDINGVAAGTATETFAIPDVNAPLTIGQSDEAFGGYFNGDLEQVAVYKRALSSTEVQQIYAAGPTGGAPPVAPASFQLSTRQAGDTGPFTLSISSTEAVFETGATVTLSLAGHPSIVSTSTTVSTTDTGLSAAFSISGQADGSYTVTITNPDGSTDIVGSPLQVEPASASNLSLEVLGPNGIRAGHPQSFALVYSNSGNVDADYAQITIIMNKVIAANFSLPSGTLQYSIDNIPADYNLGGNLTQDVAFQILIPSVAAGSVNLIPFTVTSNESVEFQAAISALPSQPPAPSTPTPPSDPTPLSSSAPTEIEGQKWWNPTDPTDFHAVIIIGNTAYMEVDAGAEYDPNAVAVLWTAPKSVVDNYLVNAGFVPLMDRYAPLSSDQIEAFQTYLDAASTTFSNNNPIFAGGLPQNVNTLGTLWTYDNNPCTQNLPGHGNCVSILNQIANKAGFFLYPSWEEFSNNMPSLFENYFEGTGTSPAPGDPSSSPSPWMTLARMECPSMYPDPPVFSAPVVASSDPNDISGPQGVSTAKFVNDTTPLGYEISFENLATASAAAQDVVITDQLDPTKVNLSTFSLGPITFGSEVLTPPAASSSYSTVVDLRPANDLLVEVNAGLNTTTGLVTWTFTSLDPTTGQPTTNPLAGFLPPDVTPPEGDGSVFFSVQPNSGRATGTQITDSADVTFDTNSPIATSQWLNTVDASPPTSTVAPLPGVEPTPKFSVSWSGTDPASGIASYSIYYSDDGGPWTPWLLNTTDVSDVFDRSAGHTYGFYSIATDNVGNVEATPTAAEATTTVPCFLAGTRIAMHNAEVRVEDLAVGDLVQAEFTGLTAVKWIGHRRIDCRRHPKPHDVLPVLVCPDAFGVGVPHRELWLSPDHAVFIDGVLIPIKYLINGKTVVQESVAEVTYYHIELPRHSVLVAEGLPCESYLDTGNRSAFTNTGSVVQLHLEIRPHGVARHDAWAEPVVDGRQRWPVGRRQ